ncbi:potassium transporter TrkG [Cucumibacter marinus]|uniref:potassium transporter TrkG n=1 Tax=Cucumibacter marinus TaxID=1121252 RepID=UPI0004097924|nr:potassium transporter TrkG [Cucumibacter marinus]
MPTTFVLASAALAGYAVALLLPLVAALAAGDWRSAEGLGLSALAYIFVAVNVFWALQTRMRPLSRAQTFSLVSVTWAVMTIAAMLPILIVERHDFTSAFFEAVSALVTLGVSFGAADGATPAPAMMVFRAITAWYGGFLALIIIIYVLAPYRVGGLPNRNLRLVLHSKSGRDPRLVRTAGEIFVPYAAFTLACAVALMVAGVPPLGAVIAGFSALSTNGYLPLATGGSVFNNKAAELVMVLFMIIGGTSILWHNMLLSRRVELLGQHRESYAFIGVVVGVAVLTTLITLLGINPVTGSVIDVFVRRLFDAASILSTSGIVHTPGLGFSMPLLLVLILATVGAGSYSPGGGLRMFRVGAMLTHTLHETRQLVFPHAVLPGRSGGNAEDFVNIRSIWSFFFVFLLTVALATLAFAIIGYSLEGSLSLAIGSLSSIAGVVGIGLAEFAGPVPDPATEVAIALVALAGRIEMLVILAVAARAEW